MTPEKTECDHFTVRRILDRWECLKCSLEFRPVKQLKAAARKAKEA